VSAVLKFDCRLLVFLWSPHSPAAREEPIWVMLQECTPSRLIRSLWGFLRIQEQQEEGYVHPLLVPEGYDFDDPLRNIGAELGYLSNTILPLIECRCFDQYHGCGSCNDINMDFVYPCMLLRCEEECRAGDFDGDWFKTRPAILNGVRVVVNGDHRDRMTRPMWMDGRLEMEVSARGSMLGRGQPIRPAFLDEEHEPMWMRAAIERAATTSWEMRWSGMHWWDGNWERWDAAVETAVAGMRAIEEGDEVGAGDEEGDEERWEGSRTSMPREEPQPRKRHKCPQTLEQWQYKTHAEMILRSSLIARQRGAATSSVGESSKRKLHVVSMYEVGMCEEVAMYKVGRHEEVAMYEGTSAEEISYHLRQTFGIPTQARFSLYDGDGNKVVLCRNMVFAACYCCSCCPMPPPPS
jgi:hypothetical protein